MQVVQTRATFVTPETFDESLTTIVARSVLEAALKEDESAELWFELGTEDGRGREQAVHRPLVRRTSRSSCGLSSEDEIASTLDGEAVESLFGEPDVEAHGLEGCDRDRRDERCDPRARVPGCGSAGHRIGDAAGDDPGDRTGRAGRDGAGRKPALPGRRCPCRSKTQVEDAGCEGEGQRPQASPERTRAVATRRSGPWLRFGADDGRADRREGTRAEGARRGGRGRARVRAAGRASRRSSSATIRRHTSTSARSTRRRTRPESTRATTASRRTRPRATSSISSPS